MFEMQLNLPELLITGMMLTIIIQLLVSLYTLGALRFATRERARLNREMFGLLKKIEGLTAHRREQMLKHYDEILEGLATRLPPTVASEAGQVIFDMESRILSRLAELEPDLKGDELSKKKMNELICSMENLEATIVTLTADAVQNVLAEGRKDLFREALPEETFLAA